MAPALKQATRQAIGKRPAAAVTGLGGVPFLIMLIVLAPRLDQLPCFRMTSIDLILPYQLLLYAFVTGAAGVVRALLFVG